MRQRIQKVEARRDSFAYAQADEYVHAARTLRFMVSGPDPFGFAQGRLFSRADPVTHLKSSCAQVSVQNRDANLGHPAASTPEPN